MPNRRSSFLVALTFGSLVGVGYPFVDLVIACRAPSSEACVWGKAYLPLTLGISMVLLGGIATILVYAFLERRRRPRSDQNVG